MALFMLVEATEQLHGVEFKYYSLKLSTKRRLMNVYLDNTLASLIQDPRLPSFSVRTRNGR